MSQKGRTRATTIKVLSFNPKSPQGMQNNIQAREQNAMGDDLSAKIQHRSFGCLRHILMYIVHLDVC